MTAAIEIKNLEKQLGGFKLGPLSLEVPRGAICGLIGPNGAGKTTTLDLLMGMGQADAGSIRLLDRDIATDEIEIKRRTAYVSPELNYVAWGSVGRAIAFVSGFYPDWNRDRCAQLLADFGLRNEDSIGSLSFGTRIKLALVMALSRDAELLLLDEPTVGLDAVARRQLFSELLAFMQKEDRTILISSHQLSDLERFADRVAIVKQGRLVTSGRMDELLERFALVQVRSTPNTLRNLTGLQLQRDDGERQELLIDLTQTTRAALAKSTEIIGETPLTLEELFLALVRPTETVHANAA